MLVWGLKLLVHEALRATTLRTLHAPHDNNGASGQGLTDARRQGQVVRLGRNSKTWHTLLANGPHALLLIFEILLLGPDYAACQEAF
jgi:hypothetical protein